MATEYSSACCTTPAAVHGHYSPKGSWTEIDGIRTYVTGSATATKAIVHVYDLFGYCPPTFQGADILASQGQESYLVFVPDFIGSDRAGQHDWFLPGADKKPLHDLLALITSEQMMTRIYETVRALRLDTRYASVQRWAGVGFCWGSKGVSLVAAKGSKSLLDVTVHTSPSRMDPEEAKAISIPTMVLPSNGEDETLMRQYVDNLKGDKYLERFDQVHGWMSARAKLDQELPRREYERGYAFVLNWLAKYL